MSNYNDFLSDEQWASNASADRDWMMQLYQLMFPDLTENGLLDPLPFGSQEQKLGFDRAIITKRGAATVDEKLRRRSVNDLLIELKGPSDSLGWFLKETLPRFVLTAHYPSGGTAVCVDVQRLKRAYATEADRWQDMANQRMDGYSNFLHKKSGSSGICLPLHEIRRVCGVGSVQKFSPPKARA